CSSARAREAAGTLVIHAPLNDAAFRAAIRDRWERLDSNQRRHTPTGLQPVPFSLSGTLPARGCWDNRALDLIERAGSAHRAAQALGLRQGLQLLERVVLDLADALTRHSERAPDLLERARPIAGEAVAELDHAPLALGERFQRALDVLAAQVERRGVERRRLAVVAHEV